MITSSTFYQLNYADQADLLLEQGTFLQTRTEDTFIIDLFELQDLLIEIFYEKDAEEPVSVMAYNTDEKLKGIGKAKMQPRLTIRENADTYQKGSYAA